MIPMVSAETYWSDRARFIEQVRASWTAQQQDAA